MGDLDFINIELFVNVLKYCIGPLAGALTGSYFAYKFTGRREKQSSRQKKIEAGQLALFTLLCQANKIASIDNQCFKALRSNSSKHYLIRPIIMQNTLSISVDIQSISFLVLEGRQGLLEDVFIVDQYYHSIIAAINERNGVHHEFQKVVAESKIPESELNEEIVDKIVGERIQMTLLKMTEDIDRMIATHKRDVLKVGNSLANELELLFPGSSFSRFKIEA
jgi:hypothetical protein